MGAEAAPPETNGRLNGRAVGGIFPEPHTQFKTKVSVTLSSFEDIEPFGSF